MHGGNWGQRANTSRAAEASPENSGGVSPADTHIFGSQSLRPGQQGPSSRGNPKLSTGGGQQPQWSAVVTRALGQSRAQSNSNLQQLVSLPGRERTRQSNEALSLSGEGATPRDKSGGEAIKDGDQTNESFGLTAGSATTAACASSPTVTLTSATPTPANDQQIVLYTDRSLVLIDPTTREIQCIDNPHRASSTVHFEREDYRRGIFNACPMCGQDLQWTHADRSTRGEDNDAFDPRAPWATGETPKDYARTLYNAHGYFQILQDAMQVCDVHSDSGSNSLALDTRSSGNPETQNLDAIVRGSPGERLQGKGDDCRRGEERQYRGPANSAVGPSSLKDTATDEQLTAEAARLLKSIPSSFVVAGYYKTFFNEVKQLGKGSYGQVYLCEHHLDDLSLGLYAVKKIPVGDSKEWLQKMLKEVKMRELLHHQNMVSYKHSWLEMSRLNCFSPMVPWLFVLMEYCDGGDLEHAVTSGLLWAGGEADTDPSGAHANGQSKPQANSQARREVRRMTGAEGPSDDALLASRQRRQRALSEPESAGRRSVQTLIQKKDCRGSRQADRRSSQMLDWNDEEFNVLFRHENFCWKIMLDVVRGLNHLHHNGIIHRDLKPANILLRWQRNKARNGDGHGTVMTGMERQDSAAPWLRCEALLADFGTAEFVTGSRTGSGYTGTLDYTAPELLVRDPDTGLFVTDYDFKSDMWSLGMLLYFMLSDGCLPFAGEIDCDPRKASHKLVAAIHTLHQDAIARTAEADTAEADTTDRNSDGIHFEDGLQAQAGDEGDHSSSMGDSISSEEFVETDGHREEAVGYKAFALASTPLKDLTLRLLSIDPNLRPSCDAILSEFARYIQMPKSDHQ